jgi:hypothetical protein
MELQLNTAIWELIGLPEKYLGHSEQSFLNANVAERLRGKHSHRLEPLGNEVRQHWDALEVSEHFPMEVTELVTCPLKRTSVVKHSDMPVT